MIRMMPCLDSTVWESGSDSRVSGYRSVYPKLSEVVG